MGLLEIIVIAIGLSLDAFAVSITIGLALKRPKMKEAAIPGIYFGSFQAAMPLAGYFAGTLFAGRVLGYNHWVAFALLGIIGGKMIFESFSKDDDGEKTDGNIFKVTTMLLLAVATSIDALAVGITFAFFEINLSAAIALIGLVTFCMSVIGVKIGGMVGTKFKSQAGLIGGIVLTAIGAKIFIEGLLRN